MGQCERMLPTELLSGPSWSATQGLPLSLPVVLCDLRPRFLRKCRVGTSYRGIARNGRGLLASDVCLAELVNSTVRLRLQVWNRAILTGDKPEPYCVLVDVRRRSRRSTGPLDQARPVGT